MLVTVGMASASCPVYISGGERYDTLQNGTVVLTWENNVIPKSAALSKAFVRDTIAVSTPSAFKAFLQASVLDSGLVFVGRIDSVIERQNSDPNSVGSPTGDTVVAGLTVSLTLNPFDTTVQGSRNYPFYARLRIDTVARGILPSKSFWIKGYRSPGCPVSYNQYKDKRFLNLSGGLASMKDLKIPLTYSRYLMDSDIIPDAHWLTAQYLVSPKFPGLRIDIREVIPAYVVGIKGRPIVRAPQKAEGKSYLPDGRYIPTGEIGAKVPQLK